METMVLQRHELVRRLIAGHAGKVADAATDLWQPLSAQIISIVGDGGYDSLYARALFLTQTQYPWLAAESAAPQTNQHLALLKTSLEVQTDALAREASNLLLTTFTDILASLVGEPLTARILISAWGDDAQERAGKEINHE